MNYSGIGFYVFPHRWCSGFCSQRSCDLSGWLNKLGIQSRDDDTACFHNTLLSSKDTFGGFFLWKAAVTTSESRLSECGITATSYLITHAVYTVQKSRASLYILLPEFLLIWTLVSFSFAVSPAVTHSSIKKEANWRDAKTHPLLSFLSQKYQW